MMLFTHIFTEPIRFIIAIGNDPDVYHGSQFSCSPADNQWYKGDDGNGGEGTDSRDSTDCGVGSDDDQLKHHLRSLQHFLLYLKLIQTGTCLEMRAKAMEICSLEAGIGDDGVENDDLYSDEEDEDEKDPEVSSSEDGLNDSGK